MFNQTGFFVNKVAIWFIRLFVLVRIVISKLTHSERDMTAAIKVQLEHSNK